jgi:hypothetical protein
MYFWMLKKYIDAQKAKQYGRWKYLIYVSTSFNADRGMIGDWFYKDF